MTRSRDMFPPKTVQYKKPNQLINSSGRDAQLIAELQQKSFRGRAMPGPAGELRTLSQNTELDFGEGKRGRKGKRRERKTRGEGRKGKGRKEREGKR